MLLGQTEAGLNTVFWAGTAGFFALFTLSNALHWAKRARLLIPLIMIALFILIGMDQWSGVRGFINWLIGPANPTISSRTPPKKTGPPP